MQQIQESWDVPLAKGEMTDDSLEENENDDDAEEEEEERNQMSKTLENDESSNHESDKRTSMSPSELTSEDSQTSSNESQISANDLLIGPRFAQSDTKTIVSVDEISSAQSESSRTSQIESNLKESDSTLLQSSKSNPQVVL